MCAHQNAVAVVTAQGGEVEPALPRQAGAAGRQPRAHQTQPVGGAEASVVRPVADCRSANNHRKQKKRNQTKGINLFSCLFRFLPHSNIRFRFVDRFDSNLPGVLTRQEKRNFGGREREREREKERESK